MYCRTSLYIIQLTNAIHRGDLISEFAAISSEEFDYKCHRGLSDADVVDSLSWRYVVDKISCPDMTVSRHMIDIALWRFVEKSSSVLLGDIAFRVDYS